MNKNLRIAIRIDDICPTMNWENFNRIIKILEKYNVNPLLGVVPNNKDRDLVVNIPNVQYYDIIRNYQRKGYLIALHGYDHVYSNNKSGLLKINRFSEMVGKDLNYQKNRINLGIKILEHNGVYPLVYMAPAHSFDKNTIKALNSVGIKYITDGLSNYPVRYNSVTLIPCKDTISFPKYPKGIRTLCLHPNTMDDIKFELFEATLETHKDNLVSYNTLIQESYRYSTKINLIMNVYLRYITRNAKVVIRGIYDKKNNK